MKSLPPENVIPLVYAFWGPLPPSATGTDTFTVVTAEVVKWATSELPGSPALQLPLSCQSSAFGLPNAVHVVSTACAVPAARRPTASQHRTTTAQERVFGVVNTGHLPSGPSESGHSGGREVAGHRSAAPVAATTTGPRVSAQRWRLFQHFTVYLRKRELQAFGAVICPSWPPTGPPWRSSQPPSPPAGQPQSQQQAQQGQHEARRFGHGPVEGDRQVAADLLDGKRPGAEAVRRGIAEPAGVEHEQPGGEIVDPVGGLNEFPDVGGVGPRP